MPQEKKLILMIYRHCYQGSTGNQDNPKAYANVLKLIDSSDLLNIPSFRETIGGESNLGIPKSIIAVIIHHESFIRRTMIEVDDGREFWTPYLNWAESTRLAALIFPNDAFSNTGTIKIISNMFENGPLLNIGCGEVILCY